MDHDQTTFYGVDGDQGHSGQFASFNGFDLTAAQPADVSTGLVSLGYIWAAVKRHIRFCCVLAVVGLMVGLGYYSKYPPSYKAATSVLLTYGVDENPASAVFDNQTIAESHTVAQLAMDAIGDHQSLGSFAASYSVAVVTDRVLQITASAPSATLALSKANAVATAFLKFRANQQEAAQHALVQSLEGELGPARQDIASINQQISQAKAQPGSAAQRARLKTLQTQLSQGQLSLSALEEIIAQDKTSSGVLSAVTGSVVLDPAELLAHSKTKIIVEYALYGLFGGLIIGVGLVVVGALASDRLRRRDDITRALGAPVKLSVGNVRSRGRIPLTRPSLDASKVANLRPIVAYLGTTAEQTGKHAALAVVSPDDPGVAALSVVSLALAYAREGRRVVLADLASGAPAAKLLRDARPGVRLVNAQQASLTLAVPGTAEFTPCGPFDRGLAARNSRFTEEVRDAFGSADVLLTLVTLDPAFGGEHLATWADSAVVMVTAGRSSWVRLQSTGAMVRSGGMPVVSAVLVGADKSDWSLGLTQDTDALAGIGGLS
jgi:capsular polysaccharide biosynthesis protein